MKNMSRRSALHYAMMMMPLLLLLMMMMTMTSAFTTSNSKYHSSRMIKNLPSAYNHDRRRSHDTSAPLSRLNAGRSPIGPIARAKKLMDPDDYNRVVEEKMKREKMTRDEAEADYNAFLENPPFYYALEKKEEYYKSLGYRDIFEGMIGEAEKEGKDKGDEMRERISSFKRRSKLKAAGVLVLAIVGLFYFQTVFNENPMILKGGLPDYSGRGSLL